jgi:hypothetical protein
MMNVSTTTKKSQDIPLSTVLLIALGLLVGTILVPEHQKSTSEYMPTHLVQLVAEYWPTSTKDTQTLSYPYSAELPAAKATVVDGSEGRLLERCADDLGNWEAKVLLASSHDRQMATPEASTNAVSELVAFLHHSRGQQKTWLHESSMVVVLALFAVFGAISFYVDASEISEEETMRYSINSPPNAKVAKDAHDASKPKPDIVPPCSEDAQDASKPKPDILTPCVERVPAVDDAKPSHHSRQQLLDNFGITAPVIGHQVVNSLAIAIAAIGYALANSSIEMAVASNNIILLALAGGGVLGVAIIRVDIREMAEEMEEETEDCPKLGSAMSPPSLTSVPVVEEAQVPHHSCHQCMNKTAAAAVSIGAMAAAGMAFQSLPCAAIEMSRALPLDNVLRLAIVACSILGLIIMRVDVREMAKEMADEPEPENVAPSVSPMCVPVTAGATSSFRVRQQCWNCFVVPIGAIVIASIARAWHCLDYSRIMPRCSLGPDGILKLVLGTCSMFGLVFMYVDMYEMTEEMADAAIENETENDATPSENEIASEKESDAPRRLTSMRVEEKQEGQMSRKHLGCAAATIVTLVVVVVALRVLLFAPDLPTALSSDDMLKLLLGISTVFGAVVMRSDVCEMAEEMEETSQPDSAPSSGSFAATTAATSAEALVAGPDEQEVFDCSTMQLFMHVATAFMVVSATVALWLAWQALSYAHFTLQLHDSYMPSLVIGADEITRLGLQVLVLLGLVIMRVDISDVAEDVEGSPKYETAISTGGEVK